jgi:hypothetical protein
MTTFGKTARRIDHSDIPVHHVADQLMILPCERFQ